MVNVTSDRSIDGPILIPSGEFLMGSDSRVHSGTRFAELGGLQRGVPLRQGSPASVNQELRRALSHVLWLGGATDTGKTTISQIIAERRGLQLYHYDRHDLPQMERLAQANSRYRAFLAASPDENWVRPEPEELLRFTLQAFRDRFPLVVEDLLAVPREPMVVVEGHGLTPELISPVLSGDRQAIWLVPTEAFKWASMKRRNKPSFRDRTSDPERATKNVFRRDMLLAERVKAQAQSRSLTVVEVDVSRSAEEMATLIERHFEPLLPIGGQHASPV